MSGLSGQSDAPKPYEAVASPSEQTGQLSSSTSCNREECELMTGFMRFIITK